MIVLDYMIGVLMMLFVVKYFIHNYIEHSENDDIFLFRPLFRLVACPVNFEPKKESNKRLKKVANYCYYLGIAGIVLYMMKRIFSVLS